MKRQICSRHRSHVTRWYIKLAHIPSPGGGLLPSFNKHVLCADQCRQQSVNIGCQGRREVISGGRSEEAGERREVGKTSGEGWGNEGRKVFLIMEEHESVESQEEKRWEMEMRESIMIIIHPSSVIGDKLDRV